jgi:hypothetical protein
MTIRVENLTIQPDEHVYLSVAHGALDLTANEAYRPLLLSLVRHIMRDRSDCTMVPVVRAAFAHPVNEWGDNVQIEVTYHARGYRAIYGAHADGDRVTKFQCYMD